MTMRDGLRQAASARDAREARAILAKALADQADRTDLSDLKSAFERDMRPVVGAIVSALEAGDVEALRGLRALLPHLLADVNSEPALADLLAHQLGKAFVAGLNAGPEEAL